MCVRPDSVRQTFPVPAYSRHILSHVEGFPCLRVLRLIRHPIAEAVPVKVLHLSSRSSQKVTRQDMGLPTFLSASLRPCHSLQ